MKPDESWLFATVRLVNSFHTTAVDPDHSHAMEATFYCRFVSEHDLKDLIERLARSFILSDLERFGVVAITSLFLTEAIDVHCTKPVEPQAPIEYNMRMRGTATSRYFQSIRHHAVFS